MNQSNQVKVWDPFVRFFHWTLVASFFTAYFTEDDFMTLHTWAGYTVAALVLVRSIWGFIGTRHARFSDFVYSPTTIRGFLKDTLLMRAKRYIGHNPAGGAMVILLMLSLLGTIISGLLLYGAGEGAGPLANWFPAPNHVAGEMFEEVHEFFANFTILLVVVHVGGVIMEGLIHKENLVKSMWTGFKRKNIEE